MRALRPSYDSGVGPRRHHEHPSRLSAIPVIVLAASTALLAKGVTTRITITGDSLATPVAITEAAVLQHFNVWSGRGTYVNGVEAMESVIIDWAGGEATSRPPGLSRYDVSFFVRYANRPLADQVEQRAYVVHYEWDAATKTGYIYLPGPDHPASYRVNVKSIHRDGLNGRGSAPPAPGRTRPRRCCFAPRADHHAALAGYAFCFRLSALGARCRLLHTTRGTCLAVVTATRRAITCDVCA